MKALTAAALAAIALTGCATAPSGLMTTPVSGTIIWRVYDDHADLEAERRKGGGEPLAEGETAGAFARWQGLLPHGACFIYTMYPGWYADAVQFGEIMEHEFRHCVEGAFHQ